MKPTRRNVAASAWCPAQQVLLVGGLCLLLSLAAALLDERLRRWMTARWLGPVGGAQVASAHGIMPDEAGGLGVATHASAGWSWPVWRHAILG